MTTKSIATWRTPIFYRVFFPLVGLYFLFATVAYFDGGADLPLSGLGLVLGVALTIGPFRPLVRLKPSEVYVRGVIFSRRMPLQDIAQIKGGYSGLTFVLWDGGTFEATGVGEKSNISAWLGRSGKSDSMAHAILSARDQGMADSSDEQRQRTEATVPPGPPPPSPAYVNVATYIGTAVFLLGVILFFFTDTWDSPALAFMVLGTFGPIVLRLWAQKRS